MSYLKQNRELKKYISIKRNKIVNNFYKTTQIHENCILKNDLITNIMLTVINDN